eukprot:1165277-Pyramimonas_sp.AAC.1
MLPLHLIDFHNARTPAVQAWIGETQPPPLTLFPSWAGTDRPGIPLVLPRNALRTQTCSKNNNKIIRTETRCLQTRQSRPEML